jgi:hypothetical protein
MILFLLRFFDIRGLMRDQNNFTTVFNINKKSWEKKYIIRTSHLQTVSAACEKSFVRLHFFSLLLALSGVPCHPADRWLLIRHRDSSNKCSLHVYTR